VGPDQSTKRVFVRRQTMPEKRHIVTMHLHLILLVKAVVSEKHKEDILPFTFQKVTLRTEVAFV